MYRKGDTIRSLITLMIPLLIISLIMTAINKSNEPSSNMSHNELIQELREDNVDSAIYQGEKLKGTLKNDKTFEVIIPSSYFPKFYEEHLQRRVENNKIDFVMEAKPELNPLILMIPDLIFMGLIIFVMYNMMKRNQGQAGVMSNFGKSRAKLHKDIGKRVTFADVAGMKEEKEELEEIVSFLKEPKKYLDIGARIPKGILLVGPPGTGKTYLSRAVAGEAGVPFYSISGSDFVEMFVGVGASRVRDLFEEGKKNAPCIIFIDEIDAVGRRRGAGLGGGNDEREQTLNQLLVEMDGFGTNEGIIIMAATNRPDILDPAILRPGRFDRQITVDMPDVRERKEILEVHLRNKKLADDVNLEDIAKQTAGFSPADLENMANEAALLTARENKTIIDMATFEEASIKVVAGPEKKSKLVLEKERVLTAYHEAGHAIVTRALKDMDKVNLITIVPRGNAGGFTSFLPEEEKSFLSRNHMRSLLVTFLGGRAAEALVLEDISTGASNDIQRATRIAREMVVTYGMSPLLGPVAYEDGNENVFLGNDLGRMKTYSEETAVKIDGEIQNLMMTAYQQALDILKANREILEKTAQVLLDVETMRKDEFEELFQMYGKEYVEEGSL